MNIVSRIQGFDALPILEKIDLKRLRYFIAVAEAGSFSRAAQRLNLAQSHLSREIMRLEAALSQRLFVRRARHVELTDAGQILRQEAGFITSRLSDLPERMNDAADGSIGSLCVGLTVAGSFSPFAARVIAAVIREERRLSLRFCVETRVNLIEALIDRRVQAAFVRPPRITLPEVRVDELVKDPILLAVPRTHRLAEREQVDLSEIAGEGVILCERNLVPEIHDEIVNGCHNAGFSPRVIFRAPDLVSALLLASAGVGVTFVPASVRPVYGEYLNFASLSGDNLTACLALITRADEHLAGVKLLRKHALAMSGLESAAGGS